VVGDAHDGPVGAHAAAAGGGVEVGAAGVGDDADDRAVGVDQREAVGAPREAGDVVGGAVDGVDTQRSGAVSAPASAPYSSPTTGTPGNSAARTRRVWRSRVRSVSVTQSKGLALPTAPADRPAVAAITSAASLASRPATSSARESSAGSAGAGGGMRGAWASAWGRTVIPAENR
jgi:hypothetical protein